MLANLFTSLKSSSQDSFIESKIMEKIYEAATFDAESPKQFAAGFLYGYTGGVEDERDNMLACELDSDKA